MKIGDVKNPGGDRGQNHKDDPGNVPPVIDPHRSKIEIRNSKFEIH
jgi:hypothetical protein